MKGIFQVAAGSVIGRQHRLTGKNNQDAYCSVLTESAAIAVVCDGCGSSSHSEVGSQIGAKLAVKAISQQLLTGETLNENFWEKVRKDMLLSLQTISQTMIAESSFSSLIYDYFLFTILGVVITAETTVIFSLGDGIFAVNGEVTKIPAFPNNAPPYLSYSLLDGDKNPLHFQIQSVLETKNVESILIGTDGVSDLMECEEKLLPRGGGKVGSISQFWESDRFFRNPDMIRRRLFLINREYTSVDWQSQTLNQFPGYLPDDTTIIVLKKFPVTSSKQFKIQNY